MTFQAYLDTIKAKTGLDAADFKRLAQEKGLLSPGVTTGQVIAWLHEDFDLGRGHAMALVATFSPVAAHSRDADEVIAKQFAGLKQKWRAPFDELLGKVREFGAVEIQPTNTYISLLRGTAKFAIVAVTADRFDVGIKLKGVDAAGRFEAAGSWNSMVTHRVRVTDPVQLDTQLVNWLKDAYDAAGSAA